MFLKPLQSLIASDIEQICKDAVQESDVVEFKEALSAKDGPDGWHSGTDHVGDRAKNEIVREVVAFANAHGGTLILGIEESEDHPKRAKDIKPIRACADLASRIAMFCRDLIDPPLSPQPAIVPVPVDGDAGVVVVSVARSRNAPHRRTSDLESFARRADRTAKMTMREIQDLTLQVDRGLAAIERRFTERRLQGQLPSTSLVMRVTGVALSPIVVPVPGASVPTLNTKTYKGTVNGQPSTFTFPQRIGFFRPILRGVRSVDKGSRGTATVEIKEDGLVEIVHLLTGDISTLYASWFIVLVCNVLDLIDWARMSSGAPGTEYGLEVEILAVVPTQIAYYRGNEFDVSGPMPAGRTLFPQYLVQGRETFSELVKQIERDFWNAAGEIRADAPVEITF